MSRPATDLWLAGRPTAGARTLHVVHKYTGAPLATVGAADAAQLALALDAAAAARPKLAAWPAWRRAEALRSVHAGLEAQRARFVELLIGEGGKPRQNAEGEVTRALHTLRLSAEEATRIHGEYLRLDENPQASGAQALVRRVPAGAAGFISPFNFPLNLVAHKVGPAIAAGCPFVLKPASATPLSALALGELLAEAELPEGSFSILPMDRATAQAMVGDERLQLLSFTGSPQVGWALKSQAGRQKVVLELGGNAACIVDAGSDLAQVVPRLITGGFAQSGQSCVSVQRILVHVSLFEALKAALTSAVRALSAGDPSQAETVVGPLIDEGQAKRVVAWIDEARAAGAQILCGGKRTGALVEPTVIVGAPAHCKVQAEEVFGPVLCVDPFEDFSEALARTNDSAYGLQAGVFTPRLDHAFAAFERLEVGGVILNDVPSTRIDAMPYGGVKQSGLGREGVRSAIESMTEPRLLLLRDPGQLA